MLLKRLCLVSFLCALLFSLSIFSKPVVIDDFGWVIEQIDRQYQSATFSSALKCGDTAEFQAAKNMCTVSCEQRGIFTMCSTLCIPPDVSSDLVTQKVVNCSKDEVTLFSSDGDIRKITAADFARYKGNPLREIFDQLPLWFDGVDKVTLYKSYPGEHTLGWKTPRERKVPALYIDGEIHYTTADGQTDFQEVIFTLVQDPSIPWFAQVVRVRIKREGTMWRLNEVN